MRSLIFAAFLILGITPAQAALVDSFALPSTDTTTTSTAVLANGTPYTIEVSGTFEIGCVAGGCPTDAEYYVPATGVNAGLPFGNTGFQPEGGGGTDIGVQINGVDIFWGPFQPSRVYSLAFLGLGSTIDMHIEDTNYGDNSGSLSVNIYSDSSIPPIPVPAAFWLFGTALIGFIGISRRRKVA
jgi:hypothetical protein